MGIMNDAKGDLLVLFEDVAMLSCRDRVTNVVGFATGVSFLIGRNVCK